MPLADHPEDQGAPQILVTSFEKLKKLHPDDVKKNDLFMVAPFLIEEEAGFNPRDYNSERMKAHIESLAQQWASNPSLIPPLMVVLKDGHLYVRDGHCRLRAAKIAIERGVELKLLTCVHFRGNDVDQSVLILTSQEGEKLNFVEIATVYQRLNGQGVTDAQIAERLNKTPANIFTIRKIASLPIALQNFIADKIVSYQEALSLVDKVGETRAVEIVKEILNDKIAKLTGNAKQSSSLETDEPNSSPKGKIKPVKVVGSDIQRKLGGTGARFTAKMKQGSAELITSLASQLDLDKGAQKVVLSADLVRKLVELSALLNSADSQGDEDGQDELPLNGGAHPHDSLVTDLE